MDKRAFLAGVKAAADYTLSDDQERASKRIQEEGPGLLIAHGMGMGKTLTSLDAVKNLGLPADIVVPAALRKNYQQELQKYHMDNLPVNILSQQGLAAGREHLSNPVMVVDEAHRARNPGGKLYQSLMNSPATKRVLLTGTPMVNQRSDILPLLKLVDPDSRDFNVDPKEFERLMDVPRPGMLSRMWQWLGGGNGDYAAQRSLQKGMSRLTDAAVTKLDDMPDVERAVTKVPLTPRQLKMQKALFNDLGWFSMRRIKAGLPPTRQDFSKINTFLNASRQVMNGDPRMQGGEESAKVRAAVNDIDKMLKDNPDGKAVAYSNFLDSGVNLYKSMLDEKGIPYAAFTGNLSDSARQEAVKQFNENKIRALLLSGAGAEGLNLKGTTLLQLLEPHWNNARLEQAAARAVRRGSHQHLPEDQRKVRIQEYLSTDPSWWGKKPTVDEYLSGLANSKDERIKKLFNALQEATRG